MIKRKRILKGTYHGRQKVRALQSRAKLRAEQIWQEAKRIFETGEEFTTPTTQ